MPKWKNFLKGVYDTKLDFQKILVTGSARLEAFSPPSKKVKTEALSRAQLYRFLDELEQINPRDALIAKLCLHGAKRINEVLSLEVFRIDFEKKQILFKQSKSKLTDDFTIISFKKEGAQALLQELKDYLFR